LLLGQIGKQQRLSRSPTLLLFPLAASLGFEHEAAAFVHVNASGRSRAIGILKSDGTLEDVGVALIIGLRWVGAWDAEHVAQFIQKGLAVGAFGCAGFVPAVNEVGDGGRGE
jgi:hypothetical protein